MDKKNRTKRSPLDESSYNSPYSRNGAPTHPNTDIYAPLRVKALQTLEAMGFDPKTMAERGIVWAEDQDPFGHVMQSKFPELLNMAAYRHIESHAEHLSEQDYEDMIRAKRIMPVTSTTHTTIFKPVQYPDSLISASRLDQMDKDRFHGTLCLFSLKQQAVVAQLKGTAVYVDAKTGRPVDIRTLGGSWPRLYDEFKRMSDEMRARRDVWDAEHPTKRKRKAGEPKI